MYKRHDHCWAGLDQDRWHWFWCYGCGNGDLSRATAESLSDQGLLQSCRQVYSEAKDVVDTTSTFRFDDRQSFRKFASMHLPVRSINLHMTVHMGALEALKVSWEDILQGATLDLPDLQRVSISINQID